MFDARLSQEIFAQLMNGKIINKYVLNNSGELIENHLHTEIMENLNDYRIQYKMCGCPLVENPTYIFIREQGSQPKDLKTDITMKACVLLLLMGKFLTEHNIRIGKLTESSGGITNADFEVIQQMPETTEILEKAGLNADLQTAIKSVLVDRHILLQKPGSLAYILSDAGKAFFEEIVKNYHG